MPVLVVAVLFWPGIAMYDTVALYGEVLSNDVDDWQPPILVRLWQALHPLGPTTGPMFALQVAFYAAGFGLIVSALVRSGRWRAAIAAALLAVSPLLLGWQMVVLKDAQMLGALLTAFGIVASYHVAERRMPLLAGVLAGVLIGYGTLVRTNALFATVPLVVLLLPRPKSLIAKGAAGVAAVLLLLAVTPIINHRIFDAVPSGIVKSQPLFDLAAIAVATPQSVAPFTPAERAQLLAKHCSKAFFWDSLRDPSACGPVTDRMIALSDRELYLDLARAAGAHPLAYTEHRLLHWNSTERWLVPPGLIAAEPPDEAEPNDEGLKTPPSSFVPGWQSAAAFEVSTPIGWPILWTAVALLLLPVAWRRREQAAGGLALALVFSALTLEASFLVISISSDLRYHLWSMAASALALILLSVDLRLRRFEWFATAVLVVIAAGGILTRSTLPEAPGSYQGMIHASTG